MMELEFLVAIVLTGLILLFVYTLLAGKIKSDQPIFVINGFYMSMREKYTKRDVCVYYYLVEWDAVKLSWEDFRAKVLGATDPSTAEPGSLRRVIYDQWQGLGLAACPDVGENGMHGSASPFEAMAERMNWIGETLEKDKFAKTLSAAGVSKKTISEWTKDPQVTVAGQDGKVSLFDSLEDMNSEKCLEKAVKIAGQKIPKNGLSYPKNEAFVFIKPHAVTDKVKDLASKTFDSMGIVIKGEGKIDGATIDNDKLIDNHYYAIANKAALTKPKDLNPPEPKQLEFKEAFGFTWTEALRAGKVFNAVDGCRALGLNGDEMDSQWAKAKKAKKLVKFGGGFYAGLVEPKTEAQ
jgi:nucleoside diphosphate kinase